MGKEKKRDLSNVIGLRPKRQRQRGRKKRSNGRQNQRPLPTAGAVARFGERDSVNAKAPEKKYFKHTGLCKSVKKSGTPTRWEKAKAKAITRVRACSRFAGLGQTFGLRQTRTRALSRLGKQYKIGSVQKPRAASRFKLN